jgi:hypothetical protein
MMTARCSQDLALSYLVKDVSVVQTCERIAARSCGFLQQQRAHPGGQIDDQQICEEAGKAIQ